MLGKFAIRNNCSLIHFCPPGMEVDGHPVIVFPCRNHQVVADRSYEFEVRMTRRATYINDGCVYRVGHAIILGDAAGQEGGLIDTLLYTPDKTTSTLADSLPPATRARLEAFVALAR